MIPRNNFPEQAKTYNINPMSIFDRRLAGEISILDIIASVLIAVLVAACIIITAHYGKNKSLSMVPGGKNIDIDAAIKDIKPTAMVQYCKLWTLKSNIEENVKAIVDGNDDEKTITDISDDWDDFNQAMNGFDMNDFYMKMFSGRQVSAEQELFGKFQAWRVSFNSVPLSVQQISKAREHLSNASNEWRLRSAQRSYDNARETLLRNWQWFNATNQTKGFDTKPGILVSMEKVVYSGDPDIGDGFFEKYYERTDFREQFEQVIPLMRAYLFGLKQVVDTTDPAGYVSRFEKPDPAVRIRKEKIAEKKQELLKALKQIKKSHNHIDLWQAKIYGESVVIYKKARKLFDLLAKGIRPSKSPAYIGSLITRMEKLKKKLNLPL